jgi:transposase
LIGDAKDIRPGRELAAWLGIVPRQTGTGGRVRMLNISKRDNPYLRAMVIHCAHGVAARQKAKASWLVNLIRASAATPIWNIQLAGAVAPTHCRGLVFLKAPDHLNCLSHEVLM